MVMAMGNAGHDESPSDLCERYKVPCILSGTPIEAWLFGPDGKPKSYRYSYMFFFSVPDLVKNHIGMIKALPGGFERHDGYLYPNDPDGIIFRFVVRPSIQEEEGSTPVRSRPFRQRPTRLLGNH